MVLSDRYTPPGYMALWDIADEYLRTCRDADFRQMRKDKTLDAHIDGLIRATREQAEQLIEGGEHVDLAWHRAVRAIILESEE